MKRIMIVLFAIGMTVMNSTSVAAMSTSKVRQETRFLTDKMAYELNLNTAQYNDAYEINFDFIYAVRNIMDDVVSGREWALDEYYNYLDVRNDDLRWVLNNLQYRRLMQTDYFYRPIYADSKGWSFRIYGTYRNPMLFYFGIPFNFTTYHGKHYRTHHRGGSYYRGRYHHKVYVGAHSVRSRKVYYNNRRADFGRITIRSNSGRRPNNRDDIYSIGRNRNNSSARRSYSRDNSAKNVGNTFRRSGEDTKIRRENTNNRSSNRRVAVPSRNSETRNVSHSTRDNSSRNNVNRVTPASSGNHSSVNERPRSSKTNSSRRSSSSSSSRRSNSNSSAARVSESRRSSAKTAPTSTQSSSKNRKSSNERSNRSSGSSRRR